MNERRDYLVRQLNDSLFEEHPENKLILPEFSSSYKNRRAVLRGLMNLRRPSPIPADILLMQDELLQDELSEETIFTISNVTTTSFPRVGLTSHPIYLMKVDAIVNSASPSLLGCFVPGHHCLDNDIHSFAGLQLRQECAEIMAKTKGEELPGRARITKGYNLPCAFVIHTVSPRVSVRPTTKDVEDLKSCYKSVLKAAVEHAIKTLAIPLIGVSEGGFSLKQAVSIALLSIDEFMNDNPSCPIIIFCARGEDQYNVLDAELNN